MNRICQFVRLWRKPHSFEVPTFHYILQSLIKLQPAQIRISCNSPCSDLKMYLTIRNTGGNIAYSQSLSGRTEEN